LLILFHVLNAGEVSLEYLYLDPDLGMAMNQTERASTFKSARPCRCPTLEPLYSAYRQTKHFHDQWSYARR